MDEVLDWLVKHQVRLLQFGAAIQLSSITQVDDSEEEIAALIMALAVAVALRGGIVRPDDTRLRNQVENTINSIREVRERNISRAFDNIRTEVTNLTRYEPAFLTAVLQPQVERRLPTPIPQTSLVTRLPVMGGTLNEWQTRFVQNDAWRVQQNLWTGLGLGDSEAQLRARLLGHAAYRGADGAFQVTRNELGSLVNSALTAFADASRLETLIRDELALREQFVAVLDNRTTQTCRHLNGSVYKLQEGPRPPLHYNCRSIRVPLVDGRQINVPNFGDWLRRQEAPFQNEVLGTVRGIDFRAGRYTPETFRDRRWAGITIQELAAREARAFEEAGVGVPFQ